VRSKSYLQCSLLQCHSQHSMRTNTTSTSTKGSLGSSANRRLEYCEKDNVIINQIINLKLTNQQKKSVDESWIHNTLA